MEQVSQCIRTTADLAQQNKNLQLHHARKKSLLWILSVYLVGLQQCWLSYLILCSGFVVHRKAKIFQPAPHYLCST